MTVDRTSRKFFTLPHLSTDELWPLVILAGFSFFASLTPLPPNDFWWHLKIGELIFNQGHVPTSNLFAWTLPPEHPFTYGAWLGELLLYALYRLGQLSLVTFARNILLLLAFWLVGYEARRRSGSWRLAALAVALACGMTINNLPIRPQIWSWLPFAIYLIVLGKFADGQIKAGWLLLLPALMVFWVNAHGAFILGGILIGIFFVGEAVRALLRAPQALSWRQVGCILGAGILSGGAMLINPRFTQVIGYVFDLMTDKPSQQLIEEWQSPSPAGIANLVFYVSILILIALLAYTRARLTPTELLLTISFLWLAWTGQRYVVWYGMVCTPILMRLMALLPISLPALIPQRNALNAILATVIFLPIILIQPWFVESFPLPERYWKMVHRDIPQGSLIGIETPIAAVEYLRQHPGGKLFNEMGYGSYLIWAMPDQGVFVDPRVELYPYEQWQDYIRITRGTRYNELLAQYGADRILLDLDLQPELAGILPTDPGWQLEYEDDRSQLWERAK